MNILTVIKNFLKYQYYKVRRDFAMWRAKKHIFDKDSLHFDYYCTLSYYCLLKCESIIRESKIK